MTPNELNEKQLDAIAAAGAQTDNNTPSNQQCVSVSTTGNVTYVGTLTSTDVEEKLERIGMMFADSEQSKQISQKIRQQ